MFTRLTTVRAKLTALVALSIVVMLAALPILSWILHTQMLDEVDNRVVDAKKSFLTELDDDLSDLTLAARVLAQDEGTRRAVAAHDPDKARQMAATFLGIYPPLDVLLFDKTGLVAQVGCDAPVNQVAKLGSDPRLRLGGFAGVLEHGCETGVSAPPSMVLTAAIGDPGASYGTAVVCMPLDDDYVTNSAVKLGVELALARGDARFARSPGFPDGGSRRRAASTRRWPTSARAWALASFEATKLKVASGPPIRVVNALDVTDVQEIIRKNLFFALLVLLFAADGLGHLRDAPRVDHVARADARERRAKKMVEQRVRARQRASRRATSSRSSRPGSTRWSTA